MSRIEVERVAYEVTGKKILNGVDISFPSGSFTGIIGSNGSGKSTLLKNIYRVLKPTEGCVYLDGEAILKMPSKSVARHMAVLPQENSSDFDYTVEDMVRMGRFPYHNLFDERQHRDRDQEIIRKYLKLLGLQEYEKRLFKTLSGGEKQRVFLARALAQETNLLILDEVTNHLDIGYQYKVLEILSSMDLTMIAAIHDLNLALRFCDRVVLLNEGRVIAEGTAREVIHEEMLENIFHIRGRVAESEDGAYIEYRGSAYKE